MFKIPHNTVDLLIVSPKQFNFYAPYDRLQKRLLTMLNPTDSRLIFKIKSNASLHYNVKPHYGIIEPYGSSEVVIRLSHFSFNEQCNYKHHFGVQCITAPDVLPEPLLKIFKQIRRSAIYIVRIPSMLEATPMEVPELPSMRNMETATARQQLRALCPNCEEQLQHCDSPRKRCGLGRLLLAVLMLGSGVAAAYFQRQHILELLKAKSNLNDAAATVDGDVCGMA